MSICSDQIVGAGSFPPNLTKEREKRKASGDRELSLLDYPEKQEETFHVLFSTRKLIQ
jgi:hypothetical protein